MRQVEEDQSIFCSFSPFFESSRKSLLKGALPAIFLYFFKGKIDEFLWKKVEIVQIRIKNYLNILEKERMNRGR